jgi:hypothetical protein
VFIGFFSPGAGTTLFRRCETWVLSRHDWLPIVHGHQPKRSQNTATPQLTTHKCHPSTTATRGLTLSIYTCTAIHHCNMQCIHVSMCKVRRVCLSLESSRPFVSGPQGVACTTQTHSRFQAPSLVQRSGVLRRACYSKRRPLHSTDCGAS